MMEMWFIRTRPVLRKSEESSDILPEVKSGTATMADELATLILPLLWRKEILPDAVRWSVIAPMLEMSAAIILQVFAPFLRVLRQQSIIEASMLRMQQVLCPRSLLSEVSATAMWLMP